MPAANDLNVEKPRDYGNALHGYRMVALKLNVSRIACRYVSLNMLLLQRERLTELVACFYTKTFI